MTRYALRDTITGIEITAVRLEDRCYVVTLTVPPYDGTDDEHVLRMQTRASWLVVLALDAISLADGDSRSVGRNMWRLAGAPRWLNVQGVGSCSTSLC